MLSFQTMTVSDWLLICSTLLGPILAVQAQKWVERATESRRRRRWIFDTIMSNRATRLADESIRALNAIDLEYRPRLIPSRKDRDVVSAWRSLFGELTQGLRAAGPDPDTTTIKAWNDRCSELYVRLEAAMSAALGFRFTDEELRRGIYYPQAHVDREAAQLAILQNLKRLLAGETAINMKVKEVPVSAEAAAVQAVLAEKMAKAYTDDGALKVTMVAQDAELGASPPTQLLP
ncbi:MAG: DUF6680 family protein [Xanthobacteraceae bacterium]